MKTYQEKTICALSLLLIALLVVSCVEGTKSEDVEKLELGATIGSLVEVFSADSIEVQGYGLVGGLKDTGSSECPVGIKTYLTQYILRQLPEKGTDVERIISSRKTAVVFLEGTIPAIASKNDLFDIRVSALDGTQTTSLDGGQLYGAELVAAGGFGATRSLAKSQGAVYIDKLGGVVDLKRGYIPGGGRVLDEYRIGLALREPDYLVTSRIRNRINERFAGGPAKAVSASQIELEIPSEYSKRKERFISMVKATYLEESPETREQRAAAFVRGLAESGDKEGSEIALETIGFTSIGGLRGLLGSSNEEVRLRAARCMLNLGNEEGVDVLRRIATSAGSGHRLEALEALTASGRRNDAAAVARRLLSDRDFEIRLAAYEQLRKLNDISIIQTNIGDKFYFEELTRTRGKTIFVSRSGKPRIVLFGVPIRCREDIFVQSADGNITVNSRAGQGYVSVIRKLAKRPDIEPIEVRSSHDLGDIIRRLCESAIVKEDSGVRPGLNVSYSDAIYILKQMSDKGVVEAEFRAGPLPKIGR